MEEIIPWDEWVEFLRPYYPSGKLGRPVKGIEKMLRMHYLTGLIDTILVFIQSILIQGIMLSHVLIVKICIAIL